MSKKGKWIEITTPSGEQELVHLKPRKDDEKKELECPNCGSHSVGVDDESIPVWYKCCECGYESSEADEDWEVT